jgi:hypothetical protein
MPQDARCVAWTCPRRLLGRAGKKRREAKPEALVPERASFMSKFRISAVKEVDRRRLHGIDSTAILYLNGVRRVVASRSDGPASTDLHRPTWIDGPGSTALDPWKSDHSKSSAFGNRPGLGTADPSEAQFCCHALFIVTAFRACVSAGRPRRQAPVSQEGAPT